MIGSLYRAKTGVALVTAVIVTLSSQLGNAAQPPVIDKNCYGYPFPGATTGLSASLRLDSQGNEIRSAPFDLNQTSWFSMNVVRNNVTPSDTPAKISLNFRSNPRYIGWDYSNNRVKFLSYPRWGDMYLSQFDLYLYLASPPPAGAKMQVDFFLDNKLIMRGRTATLS